MQNAYPLRLCSCSPLLSQYRITDSSCCEVPKWKVETSDCRSDRQASDQNSSPQASFRGSDGPTATAALAATGPRAGRSPLPQIHITNPQRQKNKRPSAQWTPSWADSRSGSVHTARVHIPRILCLLSREMDGVDGVEMPRCFPLPRNAWADDQIQCWAESRSAVGVILHLVPPFFLASPQSLPTLRLLCCVLSCATHLIWHLHSVSLKSGQAVLFPHSWSPA